MIAQADIGAELGWQHVLTSRMHMEHVRRSLSEGGIDKTKVIT